MIQFLQITNNLELFPFNLGEPNGKLVLQILTDTEDIVWNNLLPLDCEGLLPQGTIFDIVEIEPKVEE